MTAQVVDLAARRAEDAPHQSGEARCLACQHDWVAVAPVGVTWMECPKCSLMRGRFVNQAYRHAPHWNCGCGNDLFHIVRDGCYCPNCGDWQKGF